MSSAFVRQRENCSGSGCLRRLVNVLQEANSLVYAASHDQLQTCIRHASFESRLRANIIRLRLHKIHYRCTARARNKQAPCIENGKILKWEKRYIAWPQQKG
jgi:hypothetical protein